MRESAPPPIDRTPLKKLIQEAHRRSMWQVLGIYLVGAWIALQVVDVLANNFGLPEWFPAFALGLLVIGLPIVLATAFVQEGVAPAATPPEAENDSAPTPTPATAHGLLTWKNAMAGGVAAFAVLGMVTAGWWVFGGEAPEPSVAEAEADAALAPDLRSVAVLPFDTRSSLEEDGFFAEGMHDDLLTQLSKIDSITVISRTSVQKYKDTEMAIPAIATELGVATIVEGGIQRAGDRVRVNVQLIEAETDRHLWAETYDEELTAANVFHIQSDLAQKIAVALRATLTPEVVARINVQPTESLEAFDLYTRGRFLYESAAQGASARLLDALSLFEQAIAADSAYAPAWVGVADTYAFGSGTAFSFDEANPRAWIAIDRALELDPDLAEGLSRRAMMHLIDGRTDVAEADILRALELNPGSAVVSRRYGFFLVQLGRADEAVVNARKVLRLDPLSLPNRRDLENRLWDAGAFEEVVEECHKTLGLDPEYTSSWYNLAWALGMLNRFDEAIQAFEETLRLVPDESSYSVGLAWAHARAGNRAEALRFVAPSEAAGIGYDVSLVYFALGDMDHAFEYLEETLSSTPQQLVTIDDDPSADEMRAHPRYAEVLRRLGLD